MGRYVKNPVLVAGSSTGGSNVLPIGTTSQRPATASAGTMRYNSTLNMLEFHNILHLTQIVISSIRRQNTSEQRNITQRTWNA